MGASYSNTAKFNENFNQDSGLYHFTVYRLSHAEHNFQGLVANSGGKLDGKTFLQSQNILREISIQFQVTILVHCIRAEEVDAEPKFIKQQHAEEKKT
jgi:hypothetical protein